MFSADCLTYQICLITTFFLFSVLCKKGQNSPSADDDAGQKAENASSSGSKEVLTGSELTLSCYSFHSSSQDVSPTVTTVTTSGEDIQKIHPPDRNDEPPSPRSCQRTTVAVKTPPYVITSQLRTIGSEESMGIDPIYCQVNPPQRFQSRTTSDFEKLVSGEKPEDIV